MRIATLAAVAIATAALTVILSPGASADDEIITVNGGTAWQYPADRRGRESRGHVHIMTGWIRDLPQHSRVICRHGQ
jgi:hypothetical protein